MFQLANACGNANGLRVSQNAGNAATTGVFGRWLAERPDGIAVTRIDYRAKGGEQSGGYFPQVIGTTSDGLGILNGGQELDGSYKPFSVTGDMRRFGVQLICQTGGSACADTPPGAPGGRGQGRQIHALRPERTDVAVTGGLAVRGPGADGRAGDLLRRVRLGLRRPPSDRGRQRRGRRRDVR